MKASKLNEEQIAMALYMAKQISVDEVTWKLGIAHATFYRWKSKYVGLLPAEVKGLKQLEEENRKLKQHVADLSLDKKMLQDFLSKKSLKPASKITIVEEMIFIYGISIRRWCRVFKLEKWIYVYTPNQREGAGIRFENCH